MILLATHGAYMANLLNIWWIGARRLRKLFNVIPYDCA